MFLVDASSWRVSISFARVILLFALEYMKYPIVLRFIQVFIVNHFRFRLLFALYSMVVLSDYKKVISWRLSLNCRKS